MSKLPDDVEDAWNTLRSAEEDRGCSFGIEDGKLAVWFPEDIDPDVWLEIQFDVLKHKETIAKLVAARAEMKRERSQ